MRLAVPPHRLPALADRLRVLRRLARRRYLSPAARRAARPGPGRCRARRPAHRRRHRLAVGAAADTVPTATRGWDAAKKVNGRKRHIAVDTTGLLLDVVITAASVQDRDAARPLLWNLHRACPRVRLTWADSGYQAHRLTTWATALRITLQIVRRPDGLHTFTVLPRRWVVERTFAWISKHRRTVRDYEHLPASHEAMILWAMIALMTRRLAPADRFIRRSLSLPFNLRVRAVP